ncbi:hypothetical protein [Vibrio coralliilyticus]|uniref:hypothetical protein n=1 Tax=Vibrio coralliilyticus TaxID=190893 RepID=UPI001E35CE5E|nr:hypothetical protein [Vibrio coralliilyticus]MCC2521096.1 hypothetical protein [Vibrio coralliilyticus]
MTTDVTAVNMDDIEAGLGHLSSLASELHDQSIESGDHDVATRAEQIAYLAWMLSRLGKLV